MGFSIPQPQESPAEQARALMTQKEGIEAEIESQISILKANNCDMRSPLLDADGYPRADIDIYAVRSARVRIIELRNDLKYVMDSLAKALEGVYDPSLAVKLDADDSAAQPSAVLKPFAKVDNVSPSSPAEAAGLQRGDLVVKFGNLDEKSFTSTSLQPLADLVAASEDRDISIRVLRSERNIFLTLTPRKGWGGRGMLGCHIIPYS